MVYALTLTDGFPDLHSITNDSDATFADGGYKGLLDCIFLDM